MEPMEDLDSLLDDAFNDFVENDISKEIELNEIFSLKVVVVGDESKDSFFSTILSIHRYF